MLLDWSIKLKRNITNVLLQIAYFQEVLNGSNMEYFMYLSMFGQFNVYNIVKSQVECIFLALLSRRHL